MVMVSNKDHSLRSNCCSMEYTQKRRYGQKACPTGPQPAISPS